MRRAQRTRRPESPSAACALPPNVAPGSSGTFWRSPGRSHASLSRSTSARCSTRSSNLAYGLRSAGIEVFRDDPADLPPVAADEDQLNQVLLNLLVNAQQALELVPASGAVAAHLRSGRRGVEVADNGPGVPAELRSRIFEPFFTTKSVGAGTGLGLSVCHGIILPMAGRSPSANARAAAPASWSRSRFRQLSPRLHRCRRPPDGWTCRRRSRG